MNPVPPTKPLVQPSIESDQPTGDTRHRILLAAGPIFADKGFDSATVREICQAAEVNLASVNYHFGDKQKLYHQTVLYAHSSRAAMFSSRADFSDDPTQRLEQFVQRILFSMMVNEDGPWQVQLLMNEIQTPTESCQQLVREQFQPFVFELMATIDQLCGGQTPQDLQATLAMSVIGQCMIYRFAPQTHAMTMALDSDSPEDVLAPAKDLAKLSKVITSFSLAGISAIANES